MRVQADGEGRIHGLFQAMASPWEVHVSGADARELERVAKRVASEVQRIETKYSRYRDDGIVSAINHARGRSIAVDEETARLLSYAATLWEESDGLFDITTGALRRVWRFDGSDRVPSPSQVAAVMRCVGWGQVEWNGSEIRMHEDMEVDFGGFGKEYAVDRSLQLAQLETDKSVLINGGGDLAVSAPPQMHSAWRVGVISTLVEKAPTLELFRGAVATSGDANRYLIQHGKRYGHLLDPRSGWPVEDAANSITVLNATCIQAGALASIALLQGKNAESYLQANGTEFWIQRD